MTSEKILAIRVNEPELQFCYGVHKNPRKIVSFKPFSYKNLLNEEVNIKLLTDTETRSLGAKLINHIIKGYSILNEGIPSFYDVFGTKLIFHENQDIIETSPKNIMVDLEEAFDTLKSNATRGIVVITLSDIPTNVYIGVKKKTLLSKSNIRVQLIRKRTIESHMNSGGYVYLLMNIATAMYAKIGGIPWKLSRSILSTEGLILGISFSRKRVKTSQSEEIYYGAIQLFDKYGEHLYTEVKIFTASPEELKSKGLFVPYEKLRSILEKDIKEHKVPQIIIHKSAPIVDEEIEAVREIIEKYSNDEFPMLYIFTHVKSGTIYRAYDPSTSDYSIQRGLMLLRQGRSSKWIQYIIFTTGRLYRKARERNKLGTPKPLELAIDTNISDTTRLPSYIGEQILALTKLDWNTLEPEIREPITIKYSRKAAQLAPEILTPQLPDFVIADIRDLM
jgi:hypothetical protein